MPQLNRFESIFSAMADIMVPMAPQITGVLVMGVSGVVPALGRRCLP